MIERLLGWIKLVVAPDSTGLVALTVAVGLCLIFVWPRRLAVGLRWFAAVAGLWLLLAMPLTAHAIAMRLPQPAVESPPPAVSLASIDELIVFDGDNRRGRVNLSASIVRAQRPDVVWVLGTEADWIQNELRKYGLPWDLVRIDTSTGTTRAQVQWVAERNRSNPDRRMALVASRLQVPRIQGLVRTADVNVSVVGSPADREPPSEGFRLLVPTYLAWRISRDALYEHAALRYYAWKGWIQQ